MPSASGSCQTQSDPEDIEKRNQLEEGAYTDAESSQIRGAIREKYLKVAQSAEKYFKYPTGKEGASFLKYDENVLHGIPESMLSSFCGVGNPFQLSDIRPGSSILDIGCGAGFDLIVASKKVGEHGHVSGVDLTSEMLARAQKNTASFALKNVTLLKVEDESLPFEDATFDTVISNGVINLSPRKFELFQEIFRVLKVGGTLQFADVNLTNEAPDSMGASLASWAQ